jgi:SET domain-containing protein
MKALRAPKRWIDPKFARFRLRIARSAKHRYGVFALEDIPGGRQVIEYKGTRLSIGQAAKIRPPEDTYLAWLSGAMYVDARRSGSGAEFMNHSCQPNLQQRRVRGHLLLFSRRKIRAGEELTWNYHYPIKVQRIPCRCGARRCRGTLRVVLR